MEKRMKFKSVNAILDFAIQRELDAAAMYKDLATKVTGDAMKKVFTGFSREEMSHKAKLDAVKSGKRLFTSEKKILDLKIGDHLEEVEPTKAELSYQDALIIAMKAEKAAYKLYNDLATSTSDAEVQEIFFGLAQEEAKHKLRFEIEYDDMILAEN